MPTEDRQILLAKAAAERERRRRLEARRQLQFTDWLPQISPTWIWNWPHLQLIENRLQEIADRRIRKLMLFVPPRHGKTECGTIRFPIYNLVREPSTRIIVAAYSNFLAQKFSRKARKVAHQAGIKLSKERTAVEDWETEEGGGVRAAGVGTGVTGTGADLIIIDDPIKSRREANSEAYREAVWDWYCDDLYTRQEPGCRIVLTMTRWHEDDLAGRILLSEDAPNWTVIKLPALAEENDPLGRSPGQALCPDRYDEAALANLRTVLRNSFWALFQQSPRPKEGGFFKRQWFEILERCPIATERIRYWDRAATEGDGDYTAGVLVAKTPDGTFIIEDIVRGQWSPGTRDQKILETAIIDRDRYGSGKVKIHSEQEPGSSGVDAAKAFTRLLAGFATTTAPSNGSKVNRAEPLASQAEAGFVKILRGAWNDRFLSELMDFPCGHNDDQVDAACGAFNALTERKRLRRL